MNLDSYLTRAEAALFLRVRPSTVAKWHARGWVGPDGARRRLATRTRNRRDLEYRLGDLLDAERHTYRSRQSRRRPEASAA